mgnify:FL=1
MSSSTNRTRTLTTLGILTAIILVMTFTPLGYIKTMGLEITLLHIPVILGAALTGPAGGMVLGAVFGFTSFFQCFGLSTFGTTLFSINPAGTFIVCVIPRILLGLVAAYIYRGFDHLTGKWSGTITGALATICHTAMFMGTPCSLALARAPLMTVSACACVMSPGSWSLLTSTPANAVKEKARTIRPDKKRRRMETSICCGMGKTPHPTERSPAFRFLLRYPLAPFSARHYIK